MPVDLRRWAADDVRWGADDADGLSGVVGWVERLRALDRKAACLLKALARGLTENGRYAVAPRPLSATAMAPPPPWRRRAPEIPTISGQPSLARALPWPRAIMGDADITLRHVARRRPAELARPFFPRGCSVKVLGWIDTQLTHLERRVDKALRLQVDGEPHALQIELFFEMRAEVSRRMFGYLGLLERALDAEVPRKPAPPIESVAIVLSGRKRRWPKWGAYCTAWRGSRFSGAHFRIDAVYQRTVAELRARGSVLWLVFTPLARDATVKAMRAVVKAIRAGALDEEDQIDLYSALLTMAKIDPWEHSLEKEIRSMLMTTTVDPRLRRIFCELAQEDIDKAREEGLEKGLERGREETREEMVRSLLGRLFARRVGRWPSSAEELALVERSRDLGAEQVEDALLDHEGKALVRWLLGPDKAKGKRAAAVAKKRR